MRGPIYTKRRADAPDGFFDAEAAGLRWLSVPGGVAVAGVHQVTRTILVIDRVNPVAASAEAADDFGRRLAVTHDAGAAWFGVGPDDGPGLGWIGGLDDQQRSDGALALDQRPGDGIFVDMRFDMGKVRGERLLAQRGAIRAVAAVEGEQPHAPTSTHSTNSPPAPIAVAARRPS